MTHINDQVIKAIQAYADPLLNQEFRINLLAAAEDMAPKIVEMMALKQEWAIMSLERVHRRAPDGTELPLYEELGEVRGNSANREQVAGELDWQRKVYGEDKEWYRRCIGTRLYQEWTEEVQPTVDPELEALLDIPGT